MFYEKRSHYFFKLVCISEKPSCGNYYKEVIQKIKTVVALKDTGELNPKSHDLQLKKFLMQAMFTVWPI